MRDIEGGRHSGPSCHACIHVLPGLSANLHPVRMLCGVRDPRQFDNRGGGGGGGGGGGRAGPCRDLANGHCRLVWIGSARVSKRVQKLSYH